MVLRKHTKEKNMKLAKTFPEATLAVARLACQSLSPIFLTLAGSRFRRWYMRFKSPRQRPNWMNVPFERRFGRRWCIAE